MVPGTGEENGMKTFFHKHKIVLIALLGVLGIGILTGLAIAGTIRISMMDRAFTTVAEAQALVSDPDEPGQQSIAENDRPAATPEPTRLKLSAQDIAYIARNIELRRSFIIPVRTLISPAKNTMLWTGQDADAATAAAAREAAQSLTELLFEKTYAELCDSEADEASVLLFTDGTGDRDPIVRVTDPYGNYQLTLRESDGSLLCADLFTYPETAIADNEARARETAQRLGYRVTLVRRETDRAPMYESVYTYRADTGEYLAFSYCGDQLWQAAVYPSMEAMEECEYFLADVQMYFTEKAYPENFVQTAPPKKTVSEMATEPAIRAKLTRLYAKLTNGETLNREKLHFAFLRDESGAREDCWHITGEGFDIVISAYSRNVIRMQCSVPCAALADIPYEEMGGAEYEEAAADIGRYLLTSLGTYGDGSTHGKAVQRISVNAVADGVLCTMDVELEDGTLYEIGFRHGVWSYIEYYANEQLFRVAGPSGWVADSVYINGATGKCYIPDYRDWDGDLHVTRPEE